eukprot:186310-Prymnesium_polylepis.1
MAVAVEEVRRSRRRSRRGPPPAPQQRGVLRSGLLRASDPPVSARAQCVRFTGMRVPGKSNPQQN